MHLSYPPPPKKNSHPWMIFGDFIPLTSFLKLMNPALSDEAELQNFVSLSLHTRWKAIAATVRIGNTV